MKRIVIAIALVSAITGFAVPVAARAAGATVLQQELNYYDNTCVGQPVQIVGTQFLDFNGGIHAHIVGTGTLANGTSFPIQNQVNEEFHDQAGVAVYEEVVHYNVSGPGSRFFLVDHFTAIDGQFVSMQFDVHQVCASA